MAAEMRQAVRKGKIKKRSQEQKPYHIWVHFAKTSASQTILML
jgi:hypothetical protein